MSKDPTKPVEVEVLISRLLQWGVRGSLFLLLAGILARLVQRGFHESPQQLTGLLQKGEDAPHTLTWLVHGIATFDGTALITSGLILLIATPILRVALSIWAFWRERDRTYVLITAVVLALLLASLLLGKAG